MKIDIKIKNLIEINYYKAFGGEKKRNFLFY